MKKILFLLLAVGCCPLAINAQEEVADENVEVIKAPKQDRPSKQYPTVAISGKVIDAVTHEPLAGAQIKAYNNSYYTAMADEDGTFTIKVPEFVTSLSTSLEGYNINRTALGDGNHSVTIQLYSDRYLGEYEAKTTAAKAVGTSDFSLSTALSVDQEIQNRLGADVRTIQRSALNGMGDVMFINGYNSLMSNAQPLIIVDGVIFDMCYDSEMLHNGYFNNLLAGINMDDIEDVKVLKNGTAIYGAKAANGVILINTKRVKTQATRIELNASVGVELLPKEISMMSAEPYRTFASDLLEGTGTKLVDFKFLKSDPEYHYYNMYHNETDWRKEVYKEALTQNYSLHVSGGDDVAQYNLSVGYTNANATLKENSMERFNIRFNSDIVIASKFTTSFDVSYANITRELRDDGWASNYGTVAIASPSVLSLIKSPFVSPYDFSNTDNPIQTDFISDADDYLNEVLGNVGSLANPTAILATGKAVNKNSFDNTMINIAVAPKWHATKNFTLQERFSFTMHSLDESYFTPIIGMPKFTLAEVGEIENTKASLYFKHSSAFSDTRFDWAIPLGAHRIDMFGGARFMSDTSTASQLRGYNTGNDKTPNTTTDLYRRRPSGMNESWNSLAYYLNLDYNYKEKYYLQGQVTAETSSRFGKDSDAGLGMFGVRWGIFPSIQGAWVITNEKWFRPNNGVNMLKLSVGFESVGNDAINPNAALTSLSGANLLNETQTSIGLTNIGNPNLQWETTNRFNAGIEGNFINNRLHVRINYFNSTTKNLISLGTLAYVSGLKNYWTNDGELKNEGFDATVIGKLINTNNFKMELGASMGHYKNKIVKLPEGQKEFTTDVYDGQIISRVGSPIGLFYGFETDGVLTDGNAANAANLYVVNKAGAKQYFKAGDMKFVDQNHDGAITEADRTVIGDPNPDIYGNLFANFQLGKHWTLNCRFAYSLGNDIYNFQRSMLENGSLFMNQTTAVERRWKVEGQNTDIPRATYGDPMGNARFSDRWIEDGSYFKLKNVSLSYNLPITNEYIQGLSVWCAANNLFTITKYLGSDPEVSCGNSALTQGVDGGYLSSGRSFTLGVKINL